MLDEKILSVEEAIKPLVLELAGATKRELIYMMGGSACGCMGPRDGMPLCPCRLRGKAIEYVLKEKYGIDMNE